MHVARGHLLLLLLFVTKFHYLQALNFQFIDEVQLHNKTDLKDDA